MLASWDCSCLLHHRCYEVLTVLTDPAPKKGLLPKCVCRLRVNGGERYFICTLTRQSAFDGGDPRDCDGFERCWFVWTIAPDDPGRDFSIERVTAPQDYEP